MKLIDKDALVAEIKRLETKNNESENVYDFGTEHALKSILSFLDTLEVKEVDLEEDINDFINEEYHYEEYEEKWVDEKDWIDSIQRCAKHFFALGLKAQKKDKPKKGL